MHIENMKKMMECLAEKAKAQLDGNIENVDAEELGKVIDMVKDLNEGLYYATITKSMEDAKEEETLPKLGMNTNTMRYYTDRRYPPIVYSMDGRRGYTHPEVYDPNNDFVNNRWRLGGNRYYEDGMRGYNTGHGNTTNMYETSYDRAKRYYTETKNAHMGNTQEDKNAKMQSLEEYARELMTDITDMIQGATPEERTLMKNKLTTLAGKI